MTGYDVRLKPSIASELQAAEMRGQRFQRGGSLVNEAEIDGLFGVFEEE